jgi:hypothetical protein
MQPSDLFCGGRAEMAVLEQIRTTAKRLAKSPAESDEHLAGIAAYFLVIAAALHQYGSTLTDRPNIEIAAILLDLATAAPEPYSTLLGKAATHTGV